MDKPWINEPDEKDGMENGFRWAIRRTYSLGSLCGYVALLEGHRYWGIHYDKIPLDVHGGLTYSENHLGKEFDDNLWWIGFDCGHYGDIVPEMGYTFDEEGATYKDMTFVRNEISSMIEQLKGD